MFDINDFNVYEFDNCIETKRINKSLDKLTYIIETYSPDIKNANTNKNISKLMKNRRNDMDIIYYDNASKEEYINGDYAYVKKFTKMNKNKAVSNLSGRVDKGRLTIYEKRLLKYLSDGNNYYDSKNTKGKDFKTARLIICVPIIIFAVIICIVGYFLTKDCIFGTKAILVYPNGYTTKGFIPNYIYSILLSFSASSFALIRIIGRPLVYLLCSDDEREIAKVKYSDGKGVFAVIKKIVLPIILLVLAVISLYYSNENCIGFNENEIVVREPNGFTESYDNITVYRVQSRLGIYGEYCSSPEEYYYIIEHNNKFYDVPTMSTESSEGKAFTTQLNKHGITIHNVKQVKTEQNTKQ